MDKRTLQISGAGICAMLLGSLYWNYRNSQKEQCTTEFINELNKELKPASKGLADFKTFDVNYKDTAIQNTKENIFVLRQATAEKYAKTIYDAWNWYDDNEQAIYGVFSKLKNHVQGSQVASAYLDKNKVGLLDDLILKLSESEIRIIRNILKKKEEA